MQVEFHKKKRHGAAADQDAAAQLETIRVLIEKLDLRQAQALQSSHNDVTTCQLYEPTALQSRQDWAKSLDRETRLQVMAQLEGAKRLGHRRKVAVAPSASSLDSIARDFPHCVEVLDWLRQFFALANCTPGRHLYFPPILLAGPPGTGKTALSLRLARALGVDHHNVDVASLQTSFTIVGLDAGYGSGRAGLIWHALQAPCMTSLILLDEIDKSQDIRDNNPLGFVYRLLEHSSACRFEDAFLGLPVDASKILWISTCNSTDNIDPAIKSRFVVFSVPIPSTAQMPAVVRSVQRELLATEQWGPAFISDIPEPVLALLCNAAPRQVTQMLRTAYASAAIAGRRQLVESDINTALYADFTRYIGFVSSRKTCAS